MSAAISKRVISLRIAFAAALLASSAGIALADPPARVGRVSFIEGTVSFHTSDQDQWSPAVLNYPVTSGASFWTEPSARTEIQVGGAQMRMDQTTEVDIVRLDDDATQVQLNQGVINIRLAQVPAGGVAVLTPMGQVNLVQPGVYHIDAGQPNGNAPPTQASVTVLAGDAQFVQPNSYVDIQAGATGNLSGNPVSISMAQGGPNDFDNWAASRDRRAPATQAARYVSPDVTGYEDLDRYGKFDSDATYGDVWYPSSVPSDWAPYRYGHWAFVAPWGWTWVDDAPWGFAPFHYGRWVQVHDRWGWVPGQRDDRPVYAPALVAFVGGAGFGVTVSAGAMPAVGWVPLAPDEVYRPSYPVSVNYVRRVNVSNVNRTIFNRITTVNVTNVTINNFHNQRATTIVPTAAFTRAVPVDKVTVTVPRDQLSRARMNGSLSHVQPTPAARAGVADPKIAASLVAKPNEPANVAKGPVKQVALPAAAASAPPKAPGPAVREERRAGPGQGAPGQGAPGRGAAGQGGRPGAPEQRPHFTPVPASAPATAPRPGATPPGAATPGAAPAVTRPGQPGPAAPGIPGAPGPNITRPAAAPAETGGAGRPAENRTNGVRPGAPGPAIIRPTTPATAPAETGRPQRPGEERKPNEAPARPGQAITRPTTAPAETGRPAQRDERKPNETPAAPGPSTTRPATAPAETGRPAQREERRPNEPAAPGPAVTRPAEPPRPPQAEPERRPNEARPNERRPNEVRPNAAPAVTPPAARPPAAPPEHREPPAAARPEPTPQPRAAEPPPRPAPAAAPPHPAPAAAPPPPAPHPAAPPAPPPQAAHPAPPPAPHPAPAAAPKPPEPPKPAAPAAPEKKEP